MDQYNMKQGLKRFGQSGVSVIKKEVRQIFTMDTLEIDKPDELNREDCREAMTYLLLLKEKRDDTINSQGCYNGILQHNYIKSKRRALPQSCSRAWW